MIQGKLRVVVRMITERECKGLLSPTDKIEAECPADGEMGMSVMDESQMKIQI